MAKFVMVLNEGKFVPELEGKPGDSISAEDVSAYSMMLVSHSLARIADSLDNLSDSVAEMAADRR